MRLSQKELQPSRRLKPSRGRSQAEPEGPAPAKDRARAQHPKGTDTRAKDPEPEEARQELEPRSQVQQCGPGLERRNRSWKGQGINTGD